MAFKNPAEIVDALLTEYGQTFANEAGFAAKDLPSPLFRLLCLSILLSARIQSRIAVRAARSLADAGWTTVDRMLHSTWEDRTKVLNEAGYARYDGRTSSMLGATAELVAGRWNGDLRRLRSEAECQPEQERELLTQCKGLGNVGADIFFREVQLCWDELFPFADARVLAVAASLGLGDDVTTLAGRVTRDDYPRLLAALIRVDLAGEPTAIVSGLLRP